ncbi:GtrA family protein [Roseomonas sp. E05]|uniref:GtrA family protein n=1 Tax=Roseomonas sp. E05 TaxID=3046310 RepID=UPI0024BA9133|nr:GtrA family protein [Roseomonas sp. E05]MDJ0387917.1 GtrA family protein [Roseomonas sp. E05]
MPARLRSTLSAGAVALGGTAPRAARLREMLLFASVGVLNTAVDLVAFTLLVTFTPAPPLAANTASYALGALNSYLLNGKFTFRSRQVRLASLRRVLRFAAVNLACLLVSLVSLAVLSGFMPLLAAKLGSVVVTFAFSYVLNSLVVYGSQPEG